LINKKWYLILLQVSTALFTLSLFLPLKFNAVAIMILGASGITTLFIEKKFKLNFQTLPLILLFAYLLLSLLWSENKVDGAYEIERKFSYLIFPVLFSLTGQHSGLIHQTFFKSLRLICLGVGSFLIVIGILAYNDFGRFPVYHDLSGAVGFSAIYLSALFLIALFSLIFNQKWQGINLVWIVFFIAILIALSSKMILAVALIGILTKLVLDYRKNWKIMTIMLIAIIFIVFGPAKKRLNEINFNKVSLAFQSQEKFDIHTDFDGLNLRLFLIRLGLEDTGPTTFTFGEGVGDYQDVLNKKFKDYGIYLGNKNFNDSGYFNHNYHNQYLQIFSQGGGIALILLFIILISTLLKSVISKNELSFALMLFFCAWFLSESVLQKQQGIVLFSFLYTLIHYHKLNEGDI
jgi:hypothetical protein